MGISITKLVRSQNNYAYLNESISNLNTKLPIPQQSPFKSPNLLLPPLNPIINFNFHSPYLIRIVHISILPDINELISVSSRAYQRPSGVASVSQRCSPRQARCKGFLRSRSVAAKVQPNPLDRHRHEELAADRSGHVEARRRYLQLQQDLHGAARRTGQAYFLHRCLPDALRLHPLPRAATALQPALQTVPPLRRALHPVRDRQHHGIRGHLLHKPRTLPCLRKYSHTHCRNPVQDLHAQATERPAVARTHSAHRGRSTRHTLGEHTAETWRKQHHGTVVQCADVHDQLGLQYLYGDQLQKNTATQYILSEHGTVRVWDHCEWGLDRVFQL